MKKSTNAWPQAVEHLSDIEVLRRPATWLGQLGSGRPRRVAQQSEAWLGHPAHPPLTDLPIGFWTSAWLLDIVGGKRSARAARRLIGAGVLSAVPAVLTGLGDAAPMTNARRRIAVVHAGFNAAATAAYAMSWWSRRGDRRATGILLGMVGATLATAGGYLGGHLAFESTQQPPTADSGQPKDIWPDNEINDDSTNDDLSDELIDIELRRRVPHSRGDHPTSSVEFRGL
jgi:uncharacterized membrane protein